jgi:hypothetical protein
MERADDPLVTPSGHNKEATAMSDPRVVASGEGEAYVLLGSEHITFKRRGVPGEECSIFENATRAGYQGPSPHLHHNQDEDFYVLEGRFEFRVQGRTAEGGPRGCGRGDWRTHTGGVAIPSVRSAGCGDRREV